MGNACCSTSDQTDGRIAGSKFVGEQRSNLRGNLDNPDFPASNIASQVDQMNPPAALPRVPYTQRGDWTRIDDPNNNGNARGGPFRYIGSNTTYEGQFNRGLRSGLGTEITADGRFILGIGLMTRGAVLGGSVR